MANKHNQICGLAIKGLCWWRGQNNKGKKVTSTRNLLLALHSCGNWRPIKHTSGGKGEGGMSRRPRNPQHVFCLIFLLIKSLMGEYVCRTHVMPCQWRLWTLFAADPFVTIRACNYSIEKHATLPIDTLRRRWDRRFVVKYPIKGTWELLYKVYSADL